VHIFLRSALKYSKKLLNHDNSLPVWSDILLQEKESYQEQSDTVLSPTLSIPFINIVIISSLWKKHQLSQAALQGLFITLFTIFSIVTGST
jgi:hypothetical protein